MPKCLRQPLTASPNAFLPSGIVCVVKFDVRQVFVFTNAKWFLGLGNKCYSLADTAIFQNFLFFDIFGKFHPLPLLRIVIARARAREKQTISDIRTIVGFHCFDDSSAVIVQSGFRGSRLSVTFGSFGVHTAFAERRSEG
jgi:hypothetical protein